MIDTFFKGRKDSDDGSNISGCDGGGDGSNILVFNIFC